MRRDDVQLHALDNAGRQVAAMLVLASSSDRVSSEDTPRAIAGTSLWTIPSSKPRAA